jgi:hypothetical protein
MLKDTSFFINLILKINNKIELAHRAKTDPNIHMLYIPIIDNIVTTTIEINNIFTLSFIFPIPAITEKLNPTKIDVIVNIAHQDNILPDTRNF